MRRLLLLTLIWIIAVVAFAAVSFYMFISTLASPTKMDLYMPKDDDKVDEQNKAKEYGALTLLLSKNNVIYYYEGQLKQDGSNFVSSNFSMIRQVIIDKKKAVISAHVHDEGCKKIQEKARIDDPKNGIDPDLNWQNACKDKDFVVVIKPDDEATYENTVDILDEMAFGDVKRYAVVDLFPVEKEIVKKFNNGTGR